MYKIYIAFLCIAALTKLSNSTSFTYDVGCYAEYARRYYYRQPLVTCTEGGLWRQFQCLNSYQCYCTYVDTGRAFPLYSQFTRMHFFSYFNALRCPIRTQNERTNNDECRYPSLQYPCQLDTTKYIFNSETRTCDQLRSCYGYTSLEQCQNECTIQVYDSCSLSLDEGEYCEENDIETRYRHDPSTGQCQSFTYKGCGGNTNNYQTLADCSRACEIQLNVSVLVLVDSKQTYNLTVPEWIVRGYELLLNETNNITEDIFDEIGEHVIDFELFENDYDDEGRALLVFGDGAGLKPVAEQQRDVFPSSIICSQPDETGPCRAYDPRWYYNATQEKCVKFVFGGCQGNGNNFKIADDCSDYCNARYRPTAEELLADLLDENGRVVRDPLGRSRPVYNGRGELVYRLPTDTTTTATTTTEEMLESTTFS